MGRHAPRVRGHAATGAPVEAHFGRGSIVDFRNSVNGEAID